MREDYLRKLFCVNTAHPVHEAAQPPCLLLGGQRAKQSTDNAAEEDEGDIGGGRRGQTQANTNGSNDANDGGDEGLVR
jgi:hypothetical protein